MNEQLERHPVLRSVVLILGVLVYFFVGAEPLAKEYTARPTWRTVLEPVAQSSSLSEVFGFSRADWFGFVTRDGQLTLADAVPGGAAIADWAFVARTTEARESGVFELKNTGGELLGTIDAGQPFFSGDRLYSASLDGTAVGSYGRDGQRLWEHTFTSQVSAFASNDEVAIGGTVDGWLEAIDSAGRRILRFAPGGSRLPVILGVDIDASSTWIAVLSGLDSQRLVVLGRGENDYRVVSHRYLDSSYREPARVAILGDDRHVLYRQPEGIGVWEVSGKTDAVLPVKADDFDLYFHPEQGLAYLAASRAGRTELVIFRPPAKLLGRIDLGEGVELARVEGSTVYLSAAAALARLDFSKE